MLAIAIDFLAGRYVATAYNDRERCEWPPHPARLFSALVAACSECGADDDTAAEREVLRWLEEQAPPEIFADRIEDVAERRATAVYVPVNDLRVVAPPSDAKLCEARRAVEGAKDEKARARAAAKLRAAEKAYALQMTKALTPPAKTSAAELEAAWRMLPENRTRQERRFPSCTPSTPAAAFVWRDAAPSDEQRDAFRRVTGRLVRLGHSSSFVHARLIAAGAVATLEQWASAYIPDAEAGTLVVRWVGPGQIARLDAAFAQHRETEPRVLPARFVRYRQGAREQPAAPIAGEFDDDWVVLARAGGPRLPSLAAAGVARQVRRALMAFADQPAPAILSGHEPDGKPLQHAHLAVVPLPFCGHPQADGRTLGVALVLPRQVTADDRRAVLRALGRWEAAQHPTSAIDAPALPLLLGDAGTLLLQRVVWGEHDNWGLRPSRWCRPARRWVTATPVALDRNPGDLHDADPGRRARAYAEAAGILEAAVQRIGLPTPRRVQISRSCLLAGTEKPRRFPRFPTDASRTQRVLVHADVSFDEPVRGPLLVGAGRYHGLGLFTPIFGERAT